MEKNISNILKCKYIIYNRFKQDKNKKKKKIKFKRDTLMLKKK